jgi:hypothetical protein
MAKKRQTFGKIQRERERAEKRARKLEKKEERKAAHAAGEPYPWEVEDAENGALESPAEELQELPPRAPDTA